MKNYGDILRRVKQEFEWDSYVKDHYLVKYTPSNELRINCPSCGDDKFKLYVNPVKRTFHCFKCNFTMKNFDVFDFVAKTEGISRGQATKQLIQEFSRTTPPDDVFDASVKENLSDEDAPLIDVQALRTLPGLPEGLQPLLERTPDAQMEWDYLTGRGISPAEIRAMKIHYVPGGQLPVFDSNNKRRGNLANRIVIPVYGGANKLVSWQGRHVDPACPKADRYLTAPESDLSKTLWPYIPPAGTHAIIVEGVFDCLAVRRIPRAAAYATFTKKISVDQILLLKAWGVKEITLFWDKRDALPDMVRAIPDLHMHFQKVYVPTMKGWPSDLDAGNMLADSAGTDKLKVTLDDRVDTSDSLEYAKWRLTF